MRIFIDTNVLIDLLSEDRPNHACASQILQVVKKGVLTASMTTQSIIDASYVQTEVAKGPVEAFREAIRSLSSFIDVISITREDIEAANNCHIPDYEDAAQVACALNSYCDAIITSDKKIRAYTSLPVYTPQEFNQELFGAK